LINTAYYLRVRNPYYRTHTPDQYVDRRQLFVKDFDLLHTSNVYVKSDIHSERKKKLVKPGGGPLQMLPTLTLNLLPASPKNSATGPTFGSFRKGQKVNHLHRKFGPFEDFFAKKFGKI
jgi:hypothetical protein